MEEGYFWYFELGMLSQEKRTLLFQKLLHQIIGLAGKNSDNSRDGSREVRNGGT